jgi:hypothetical protein
VGLDLRLHEQASSASAASSEIAAGEESRLRAAAEEA